MSKVKVVVGISGATGFLYGIKSLQLLREMGAETHLVMSKASDLTRQHETTLTREQVEAMADVVYRTDALGAPISSGSFRTAGMIVAPCSMHTLGAIAASMSDNLLTRAADVVLKERRPLILMTRETPLHLGHLRNMATVTEYGAIVFPPVPALYTVPASVDQLVAQSVSRALGLLGFDHQDLPRWGETIAPIQHDK